MLLRSILAVLSAPIVYGAVCVPTNWLVVKLFPSHFDQNWITKNHALLLLLVSLTIFFAGASGFVGAVIARDKIMVHTVAICVLQLAIGVAVQRQYWNAMPLWYHFSFFGLLVMGIPIGAWLQTALLR